MHKTHTPNIPSNTTNPIKTIGDVHDTFAETFGRVYTREGNFGKALALASKDTRHAVRQLMTAQAADKNCRFQAISAFRSKWATLLGQEPMLFNVPEKGHGLEFEPEASTVQRLFTVLLESTHHVLWREFFTDMVATSHFNNGHFLAKFSKLGEEHDKKIVALKAKPAEQMSVNELEENLTKAS